MRTSAKPFRCAAAIDVEVEALAAADERREDRHLAAREVLGHARREGRGVDHLPGQAALRDSARSRAATRAGAGGGRPPTTVPTVESGVPRESFCSRATVGGTPSSRSTSGRASGRMNWRTYVDRQSRNRRWPSANSTSNASVDLPEPETPVTATSASRGMSTSMLRRLCSRAPTTRIARPLASALARRAAVGMRTTVAGRLDAPAQRRGHGAARRCRQRGDRLRRALADDASALVAGLRSEVDDPVGRGGEVHVVLDDHDRVARVDEPLQRRRQHGDVGRVQAGRRLVEQVQAALRLAGLGERLRELQPLRLAARQRRRRLRQRQVAEAEVDERPDGGHDRRLVGEDAGHLGRRQVERVGDRQVAAADLEHLRAGSDGRRTRRTSRTRRAGTAARPSRSPRPRRRGTRPTRS